MTYKPTNWQALCADIVRASDAVQYDAAAAEGDFLAAVDNARQALDQHEPEGLTDEPLGDLIDKWVQEAFRKKPYGCKHPTHTYVACKAFEHGRDHAALTAIAQPEPEGLTNEELLMTYQHAVSAKVESIIRSTGYYAAMDDLAAATLAGLHAVLQRWGRPALAQPAPEGPTDEERELQWPPSVALGCYEAAVEAEPGSPLQQLLVAAGDLLESRPCRPAIKPVPVSARPWEREGWCDADGKCWWGRPSEDLCNSDWFLATRAEVEEFCDCSPPVVSLPHHALPVPQP